MPRVIIRVFGPMKDLIGSGTINVDFREEETLMQIINLLLAKHKGFDNMILETDKKRVRSNIKLLINGETINLPTDGKRIVKDGDVVAILPPVGGG